jgi:putative transposase
VRPSLLSLREQVGVKAACHALNVPRASFYRQLQPKSTAAKMAPPLALSPEERQVVLDVAHEQRFWDLSPYQIHATLLDEGVYHCSIRTIYRILAAENEVRERRRQTRRINYVKPELLACAPNQVWSWDITKLKGPAKWSYFYLYVILDIFSRYVVGWMVAHRELGELAERLIEETCQKQRIQPEQLTIHADRGSSMKSKQVAQMMADLGVTKTHSRPHVSNDNPFSEAQFKTLKYRPDFPDRFGSLQDARAFCQSFLNWYNNEHKHSGIALLTPAQVHYQEAPTILQQRAQVLAAAFRQNPARFKGKMPTPLALPGAVWINPPATKTVSPFAEGQVEGVLPPSATSGPAGSCGPIKTARSAPPSGGLALTGSPIPATNELPIIHRPELQ